ncbi:MAG: hypothetical protein R3A51_11850 [Nannocystaceae bacterium]|nr:hypothetical protein [Myxococcales bacterium]
MTARSLAFAAIVVTTACAARPVTEPPEPAAVPSASPEPPAPVIAAAPEPTPPDAPPATPRDPSAPLDPEQRRVFLDSPQDEPAETRGGVTTELIDKQYLAGNERTLQIFEPVVRGLGGGYVGVGSDQAYLFIGWARPEFAWLIDYDADVVAIHAVYKIFFQEAETPEAFLTFWTKDGRDAGKAALARHLEGDALKAQTRLYLRYRGWIHRRLAYLKRQLAEAEVTSFLTDLESYQHIQAMLAAGRIRPMVADLNGDRGVVGIAAAAQKLGVPIRLLYLSNAEEYWTRYSEGFRANLKALPFDERSQVVRTLLTWAKNQDYVYNAQGAQNFLEWLAHPDIKNVYDIAHARPRVDPEVINYFVVDTEPEASPAARKAARRRGEDS